MPPSWSWVPTVRRTVSRGGHAARMRPQARLEGKRISPWAAGQPGRAGQPRRRAKISAMSDARAGQPAQPSDLIDVAALVTAYYTVEPDPAEPAAAGRLRHLRAPRVQLRRRLQRGAHPRHHAGDLRVPGGAGLRRAAVHRPRHPRALRAGLGDGAGGARRQRRDGAGRRRRPVHPHARRQPRDPRAPTAGKTSGLADGIVVTPSHNPPRDGGFKYNPPHGGPADTDATGWIADRANDLLRAGLERRPPGAARPGPRRRRARTTSSAPTSTTCRSVVDLDAIRNAGVRIGADPLGGASVDYWAAIAERHRLDLTVVNPLVDPTWRFMTLDWDGKIRMDCSSPSAMASLVGRKDEFQIATGNDADADRHGIVTPDARPDEPQPLPRRRDRLPVQPPARTGPTDTAVGKTLVSSSLIDRVVADLGRPLVEVPVGFKWFVPGPARRLGRLRRRGVRRRLVPAPRRQRLDDGQGRHPAGAAGQRDPGRDGPVPLEAAPPADRPLRRVRLRPDRRPGDPRGEGGAGQALPRGRSPPPSWPASRSPPS